MYTNNTLLGEVMYTKNALPPPIDVYLKSSFRWFSFRCKMQVTFISDVKRNWQNIVVYLKSNFEGKLSFWCKIRMTFDFDVKRKWQHIVVYLN